MRKIYVPWARKAAKEALTGLDGADLRQMLTKEELAKVDEVRRIITECRNMLYAVDTYKDGEFLELTEEVERS